DELEKQILKEGPDTVAMFLAEPVQGAGGVIVPQDDYFPRIREICDQYDVLLVADEVITGFGRTGKMFGLEHWNVQPDLIQFAKAITSGYFPLGGIGVSDEIAAVMNDSGSPWMHAYTYSSHPVGCAVALAMLDIIEQEDFVGQAAQKGKRLLVKLKEALSDHPNVGDVRGLGMMCAVEYVQDRDTREPFDAKENIGAKIQREAVSRGMFSRVRGDVYCLAPPIVTEESTIDDIAEILAASTQAALG
ncbi:MAG TPA: aspartate aminotransferase family protein, partial [Gammaproteobacteria bacterium]|nr:aspartate aminotransferase family protein [Gammaproteobacteria bacterium]